MSALLTTLGLRAAPGQTAGNHASALLMVNWFFAYILTSPRGAKMRLGIDHNVNPRDDLATYGEAAVQSGKITRGTLDKLKRQTSAHANVQEGFTLFVAAILMSLYAGLPNETINTVGIWYSISRVAYHILYCNIETRSLSLLRSAAWWSGNISCLYALVQASKKLYCHWVRDDSRDTFLVNDQATAASIDFIDLTKMKFLAIGALFLSTVGALATEHIIEGAQIIPASDEAALKKIGAHGHHKYHDRRTVIIRSSKSDTDDVSDDFLWGIKAANHGGRLLLQKGKTYVIGKKLDLSFLDNIEVQLEGEVKFTDDIDYWQANNFYYSFQKSITFWVWGGQDIKIFGKGTLNGNGQEWYNAFAGLEVLDPDNTFYRPILFLTDNATRVSVEGITQLNSPCWTNFFVRTKDISFDDVFINAFSTNASALPKNTDGFDSLNVDGLSVTNTRVDIGDDCFSPKPNTTNIFVQNLLCNNTHGVSMGSIGQYSGIEDIIENAWIENLTLLNGQNGVRLKAWAGPDIGFGRINNITYKDVHIENTDAPIVLDQCYFNLNATTCAKFPSSVNFTNINFENVHGTSSGKNGKVIGDLTCSPNAVCSGIKLSDINITSPAGGPPIVICDGIDGDIGVECQSSSA
ncbi:Glycoside hydrolase, family 28 [Penicillium italicum]|uniref:galacturonan 1,4-alpha-galacturonidase n=1 Tax=Penicillium italicum TaxID=40296 RepID=A0A0A2KI50_PENIT|nr:Glycoside hydrolase, family 28 [Penicillium italicum]